MSCNKGEENKLEIDVNISNLILTPLTCATLVNKVIKCLIYEKSQIPYPYEWLKTIVNKKRKALENVDNDSDNTNYQAERHFRTVSNAYDTTENMLKQIHNQFKTGSVIEEIVLLFGGSEMSPKEAYRIRIPRLDTNHLEANHVSTTNKLSHTILRQIFLSPTWMNADNSLTPTNMFLFLKIKTSKDSDNLENLQPNASFYITKRTSVIDINFNYDFSNTEQIRLCDCNFSIFQDEHNNSETKMNYGKIDNNDRISSESEWYQVDYVLKGFKEEFLKKVPLSQLW